MPRRSATTTVDCTLRHELASGHSGRFRAGGRRGEAVVVVRQRWVATIRRDKGDNVTANRAVWALIGTVLSTAGTTVTLANSGILLLDLVAHSSRAIQSCCAALTRVVRGQVDERLPVSYLAFSNDPEFCHLDGIWAFPLGGSVASFERGSQVLLADVGQEGHRPMKRDYGSGRPVARVALVQGRATLLAARWRMEIWLVERDSSFAAFAVVSTHINDTWQPFWA